LLTKICFKFQGFITWPKIELLNDRMNFLFFIFIFEIATIKFVERCCKVRAFHSMMKKGITIALDGPAGSGKSTTAREVAKV
jgi:ABC-type multidrug transport system fused ATPase/permease subunit